MLSDRCCFAASRVIHERHRQLATCSAHFVLGPRNLPEGLRSLYRYPSFPADG
jgi:hypothetical protein